MNNISFLQYSAFLDAMSKDLNELLGNSYSVEPRETKDANNSVNGLYIKEADSLSGVVIDVEDIYHMVMLGDNYNALLEDIAETVIDILENKPEFPLDKEELNDYTKMKPYLTIQLVNAEENKNLLDDVPYAIVEDMAVIYKLFVPLENDVTCQILINNELFETYGISKDQLYMDAIESMSKARPGKLLWTDCNDPQAPFMVYQVTTEPDLNGASAIFYPGFLDNAAKEIEGNFYLLPVSIHEMLLIKENPNINPYRLKQSLLQIRQKVNDPDSELTNSVYLYDANVGKIKRLC